MTVTVPAKKEGAITFAPYNGTISLKKPPGLHATVVLTLKDDKSVQQTTYYIAELAEHGAKPLLDPPQRPCINPFWFLQKITPSKDQTPNMVQRNIQVACTHAIAFPKEIQVQGNQKQMINLDIPVLVNKGPLERGATLVLE